jgi:tetratricopeptide (TPR) repeat protein
MTEMFSSTQEPEPASDRTPGSKLLQATFIHVALLVMVTLIIYSNTFQVPFLFDDEGSIQLNPPVHGLANYFGEGYNFLPNRAFCYLTFALNYELGGLNVTGYHIVNLVIHITATLMVYYLVRLTFKTPNLRSTFTTHQTGMFALVVALFFASHPIQTQAVTYIVQRLSSLATLFYLTSLVCYVRWRIGRNESASLVKGIASPWFTLSLVSAVLSMKTKEIAFTLPVIILLYEYSFFGWPGRKLLAQMSPLLLTISIIPYTVYSRISPSIQSGGTLLSDVNTPAYNVVQITRWEYLFTQFSVILTYLRLLILPVSQNLDYDYPVNHTLFEFKTLIALLAILSIFLLAVYLFLKSTTTGTEETTENTAPSSIHLYRLASFGILWFFITLSVESSIITIQDVIFEHRLYLPSFGFFLTAVSCGALVVLSLERSLKYINKVTIPIVAIIILSLSGATYARNNVWQDWITIWSDTVSKSQNKPRPHNVLGIGYFYALKFDEAMREYQAAVRLKPDYIEAYYNMGLVYSAKKQRAEAIYMYRKVLSMSAYNASQYAITYNEIGMNFAELGEMDQAAKSFSESVKHEPDSVEFRNNYAYALMSKGDMEAALQEFQNVLKMSPGNSYATEAIKSIETQKNVSPGKPAITPQHPTRNK